MEKKRKSRIAVETTVKVERDKFKRPVLILPPEIPEGAYQLLALKSNKLIIMLIKKEKEEGS